MKKITWDSLAIELTRKCQLCCPHCFRGESQNLNISNEDIDRFFQNTEIINHLYFTGGEPTLNLDSMQYILDKLYEYGIPVFKLGIVTNGYEVSDRFINIVRQFKDLIALCLSVEHSNVNPSKYITITMSMDDYHQGYDKQRQFLTLKEKLSQIGIALHTTIQGDVCIKRGRATKLKEAFSIDSQISLPRQIELKAKNINPSCPNAFSEDYQLLHDDQVIVICDLLLTARGNIVKVPCLQNPYEVEDRQENIILNVSESKDYVADIVKYNVNKFTCCEATMIENEKNLGLIGRLKNIAEATRVSKLKPEIEDLILTKIVNPDLVDVDKNSLITTKEISNIGMYMLSQKAMSNNMYH